IVEGDLLQGVIAFARSKAAAGQTRKTRDIALGREQIESGVEACAAARAVLGKTAKGQKAPYAAVSAIEAGVQLAFDQGSARERELFAECVVSIESRALRHLFFAEREVAKIPGVPTGTPVKEINRAAVVGAGTMGGGIAMTYANAGIPVLLKEIDDAAVQ